MKKRHFSAMLITFIALFCLTDRAYAQYPHAFLYSNGVMTDLGTLGGVDSYAFGINDSGQIVGTSSTGYGQYHAFLYSNGVMTDLTPSYYYSGFSTRGINDSGQIVGEYQGQAVSWSEGVMTSLGSLVAIGKFSVATGINNSGQIIGDYEKASGAFLYSQGTVTDLGILPGYLRSHACGINDSGQIVGYSDRGYGQAHAFLYFNGVMTDLGTLGGIESQAYEINDSGQIVGTSQIVSGEYHAFLYFNGVMTDLGPTTAVDINDSGQILIESHSEHTFLYSDGEMTDLGDLGGLGSRPTAINNNGEVVGYSTTPIPLPSTLLLLGSGLGGLAIYGRRWLIC